MIALPLIAIRELGPRVVVKVLPSISILVLLVPSMKSRLPSAGII